MILRLNRDTKIFVFFRNEIDKLDRKSHVKKKDKDKISAFRDLSMRDSRSFRDFVFEFKSSFESSSQSEFVVDSSIVVFVTFVAFVALIVFIVSIVFISIDNAILLKMFFQLLLFSFKTIFFSIDFIAIFVAIFVTNSFSIDSITIFVVFVIVSIVTFEIIKIVNDLNINDIDVLLKKYDRAQIKLFWNNLDVHDQNRVQKKI
jgi:hypothetical protein